MRMGLKVGGLVVLGLAVVAGCGSPKAVVSDWGPVSTDVERAAKCVAFPDGIAQVKWSARTIGANSRVPGPVGQQMYGIAWLAKPGAAVDIMKSGKWDPVKLSEVGLKRLGIASPSDGWFNAQSPSDSSVAGGDTLYFNAAENAVYFSVTDPSC
ncbi:hypothetical protein [Kitasatospora sp. NPDC002040]|uniref:hypothetical protein n=1 Tax=Kitasatospora sp. NPDC002040 TaxID=3154661 RepID=UPI00332EE3B3